MTWTLHNGDCLDPVSGLASLPDRSIDHVITDPPYEAEAHSDQRRTKVAGWRTARLRGEENRVAMPTPLTFRPITEAQRTEAAAQIGRVCRGWAIVFCQVEAVAAWKAALEAGGMRYRRTIPWVKPDAMPALHGRWPGQSFESIVLAQAKGASKCPGGGKSVYYQYPRAQGASPGSPGVAGRKAPHPTTKPYQLMRDLVELVSAPGEIICDPFAGSGSTGVAALSLGRRFVGWEVDIEHAATARRRLVGDEAKPRAEQPSLFDATGALP